MQSQQEILTSKAIKKKSHLECSVKSERKHIYTGVSVCLSHMNIESFSGSLIVCGRERLIVVAMHVFNNFCCVYYIFYLYIVQSSPISVCLYFLFVSIKYFECNSDDNN